MSKYTGRTPLRQHFTAVDVRARFEVLDAEMPDHYPAQEIWDSPLVAYYIALEVMRAARRALADVREG